MPTTTVVVALIAGCGAGIVTGLIGASAVTIAVPILVTFTALPAYAAIGASLLTDVFASLVAAWIYHRHGRLHLRSALLISATAVAGAQLGSWASTYLPDAHLGVITAAVILATGLRFIFRPESLHPPKSPPGTHLRWLRLSPPAQHNLAAILGGLIVGLICGAYGAGGGISILLLLVYAMGFSPHEAIGTSVLVMALTAASGAAGHAIHGELPWAVASVAAGGGIVGAISAAAFANRCNERLLARIAGVAFATLAALMLAGQYLL